MKVWTSFEIEEKSLPIVLPSGWAVIKKRQIQFKAGFQRVSSKMKRSSPLLTTHPHH